MTAPGRLASLEKELAEAQAREAKIAALVESARASASAVMRGATVIPSVALSGAIDDLDEARRLMRKPGSALDALLLAVAEAVLDAVDREGQLDPATPLAAIVERVKRGER